MGRKTVVEPQGGLRTHREEEELRQRGFINRWTCVSEAAEPLQFANLKDFSDERYF